MSDFYVCDAFDAMEIINGKDAELTRLRAENDAVVAERDRQRKYADQFQDESLRFLDTINELRAENERLRAFVADQLCDCYDDYHNMRSQMCRRCKLLGRE